MPPDLTIGEVQESTISRDLGIVFRSLCRPGRCEKEDQESTISRDLGIVFGSLCRPGHCEKEDQESTLSRDLGILFGSFCRPGRCEKNSENGAPFGVLFALADRFGGASLRKKNGESIENSEKL